MPPLGNYSQQSQQPGKQTQGAPSQPPPVPPQQNAPIPEGPQQPPLQPQQNQFSAHDAGAFIKPLAPGNFQICGTSSATALVTIYPDGRVELNPNYTPDEAARAFWDAVIRLNPYR